MKLLLTFTAIIEGLTGLAFIIAPSFLSEILLGQTLQEASGIIIAMVAGTALLSLSTGWLVCKRTRYGRRNDQGLVML